MDRHRAVHGRRARWPTSCSSTCRQRVANWIDPFADRADDRLPDGPVAVRAWAPAASSAPGSAPGTRNWCRWPAATSSSSAFGEELGFIGLAAMLVVYMLLAHARPAQRAGRARHLRQAAGRRPVLPAGVADVRGHRRRQQAHPGDRPDRAVPVRRRLVPAGQLHHGGAAAADLRLRAPARRPAVPSRRRRSPRQAPSSWSDRREQAAAPGRPRHDGDGPAAAGQPHLRAGDQGRHATPTTRATTAACWRSTAGSAARSSPRTGTILANSVETKDAQQYLRVYKNGPMYAPVTGYFSSVYGATGIERAEDDVLNGSDDEAVRAPAVRPDHRPGPARRQRAADHRPQGAGRRLRRHDGQELQRRGGGDQAVHRRDPGHGEHAVVRPEPAGRARQHHPARRHRQAEQRPDKLGAEPSHPGDAAAGLHVQAGGGVGRAVRRRRRRRTPRTCRRDPTITLPGTSTTLSNFASETCPEAPAARCRSRSRSSTPATRRSPRWPAGRQGQPDPAGGEVRHRADRPDRAAAGRPTSTASARIQDDAGAVPERHRPAGREADPDAGRHDRGDHRQRRRAHAAAAGEEHPGPGPVVDLQLLPAGSLGRPGDPQGRRRPDQGR